MSLRVLDPVRQPSPEIIALLEELLERAKAGEFASVAVAWSRHDGYCGHMIEVHGEQLALRAGVAVMSARFDRTLLGD